MSVTETERAERLAEALRANLHRRKAQARQIAHALDVGPAERERNGLEPPPE